MEIFQSSTLFLGGALLVFAGTMRLLRPSGSLCLDTFLSDSSNNLRKDHDLMSEMRGAGVITALFGIVALSGILAPEMRLTSLISTTIFYLGYALGRGVSWVTDGEPTKRTKQGFGFEIVLGSLNAIGLVSALI